MPPKFKPGDVVRTKTIVGATKLDARIKEPVPNTDTPAWFVDAKIGSMTFELIRYEHELEKVDET